MQHRPMIRVMDETQPGQDTQHYVLKGKFHGTEECYTLLEAIREGLDEGILNVRLEMSDVVMINSCGVGIIAAMATAVGERDGQIELVGLQDRCRKVLELTHLNEFLVM